MSRKKEEGRKTQKGKLKNKLCFLAAAVAAGTITTEDKKLYGGNVCTVRVTGVTTGNPTTLGSAPGSDAIACGNGAIANGMGAIATGKGSFTGYNRAVAIGEDATAVREYDVAIGSGAGLYNQGLNAKKLPNGNLNTGATRGYNVIIGANAMVGDDSNNPVYTSQGIAIGGSGSTRDTGARKYGDSGGAWAKGDQSIAIGGDTIAEGHSSIAIGGDDLQKAATKSVTYTLGSGSKTASLLTAMSDLAGVAPGDITSFNATKSGSGAVALGVKSISGDLSLAIGTMSKANKVNATAVGTGAVADLDNSVAIGGGATTVNAAGTQETSATINGVTYSNFAGGSGTKVGDVVSLGKNGTFNRQIKNVAAGNISATSTDAVNGSQLYSVAQTLQDRFKYVSINSTETGNADNKGALATNSIAIGPNASATVTAENAVVVGNGAKTTEQVMNPGAPTQWTKTGKNSVVIGNKASTNSEGSVAIGHEAKVDNTTGNSGSTIGRYKNDDNSTYMGTSLAQNNIYADPSYVGTQGIAIGANSYSDYQGMSMGVGARSKNLSLALGYFSNAEGTSSIATGVGAYAKGANSISSGRQSSTISTGSVALGVAARGGSTADGGLGGSIAVGAASDATHEQAIAIGGITNANTATLEQGRGDNTQATAARATAIGANAKAQAESSIAFGTKANVGSTGTNAVAIGKDSSATIANGVALGSESKATTAAGVTGFDMADGRSNVYSGLAGTAKTANMAAVSVGDGANKTRQITGVAAGKEDTDAVNVAQLKSTNLKIAGNTTSGGADVRLHDQTLTVKGDGTYLTSTAAGNTITMELKQNVKDKIDNAANKNLDNLNPAGVQKIKDTAAWNVVANSGTAQKVQGGDTVKFKDGDNIEITQAGKDFTIATKRDVNFNSVTINNGPKLSSTGIDAGNKKITKVANGTDNDDAVNVGQLNAVKNSPMKFGGDSGTDVDRKLGEKLNVKGGATGNLTSNNIAVEANGNDTLNIKLAENVNLGTNGSVKIGDSTLNNSGLTITGGPSITKTGGINAGGKTISNVADGTANDHAVNLGQLNNAINNATATATSTEKVVASTAADNIATVAPSTGQNLGDKNATYEVTVSKTAVQNIAKDAAAWNVVANSGTAQKVEGGDTVKFLNGDNIQITQAGKDFTIATKRDVTFDSVTIPTGNVVINNSGINAGGNKITNVADGTVGAGSTDAVNGGQLHDVKTSVTNNTTALNNLKSNTIKLSGDSTSTTAERLDKNGGIEFGVKSGDTRYLTSSATGTDITLDLTPDAKAKINKVATLSSNTISLGGDTGTTNTQALDKTGGIKFNVKGDGIYLTSNATNDDVTLDLTQATKNKINNAATNKLDNLDPAGIQKIKDTAAWNVVANSGTAQKVEGGDTVKFLNGDNIQITQAGKDFTIATKRDVTFDSVTIPTGNVVINNSGINAGGNKITNVDDGTDNDDAVNLGQLNAVKNSPMTFGGDSGTDVDRKLGEKLNIKGGATGNLTNNNIAVEADGNDTLNIKLAENVNLGTNGSVKIGDSTLNNNGLTITGGPSITKTGGINAGGNKITNVADGTANDHAVNLGQLNTAINNVTAGTLSTEKVVASTAADNIATVAPSTGQNLGDKNATYEVTVSKTAVQNIAKDAAAWNVVANSGTAQKVEGGDTVKFLNGDNIQITQAGKDFTIATKRDVTFDSVTINNGPKLSSTGIDAGNKKITKVDDGTDNDDAVNLGQLNAVKNSPMTFGGDSGTDVDRKLGEKLNIKGGATGNLTNNNIAVEADGNDTLNIKLAENVNLGTNGSVKIGDSTLNNNGLTITGGPSITKTGGINAGGKTISNVANGTANDHAVNLGQLNTAINNATATATSTEKVVASTAADNIATVAPSTGQNLGDKNATYEVTVSKTAVQNIAKDAAAWNVVANSGTAQKVEGGDTVKFKDGDNIEITQNGKDFTFATKRNVNFDSVTVPAGAGNVVINNSGINAGGNKITNVDDGTANDHAVNLGQLNAVKNSPMKFGGDSGTDVDRKLGEKLNVKGGATGNLTNNNIAVEADGNDTLNIKLAENVDLGTNGSVKIGDSTLNNSGLTITGGPSITKTGGINAGGKTISNVANGTANDHAVNLGQLNTAINNATATATSTEKVVASTAADNIATVAPSTGQNLGDKNATYEVTVSKTAVQNIAKDAAAWNVVANSGTAQKVEGGDTVKFKDGDNIEITQNGKDFTFATKRNVNFDSVTVPAGAGNVVINNSGINAGGNKITNVDDGTANDHAVNLGQLNAVKNNPMKFGGDSGTDVDRKLGEKLNVKGGATGNLTNNNIAVEADGNDTLNIKLAENVDLGTNGSVKIGDSTLNNDGLTITGGPSITKTGGINAGGNKITNVADGTVGAGSTDAVNGGQLHDVKTSVTNNTTALNNLKSNTIKLSGDSTSTTAERLDKNGGIEFGVKSGDTHYLTSTATGTDITLDLTSDAKAKIDKVATLSSNTVSLGGDTGTTNTQALDKTGGIKFNVKGGATGNLTSNNIAVEANGNDTLNIKLAENVDLGTNGSVKIGDSTLNNNGLTITGGPSITKTGGINAGGNKITNVADGTANDHAVNLGQLNNAINNATATATSTEKVVASIAADNIATVAPSTGQNLGDKNATYEVTVSKTAVQNIAKDAAAWNVVANSGTAQKVEGGDTVKFLNGDNIQITQAGKDFTIATKRDVNFDSVTVPAGAGNVVINNSGINAGGNKITNVDDGTANDHAVNLGQLNAVKNNPMKFGGDSGTDVDRKLGEKLNIKGGATGNLTNNNIAVEADGNDTLNIKLAENVNLGTNGSVKIGDSTLNNNGLTITGGPSITKTGGINAGGNKITNVADGTVGAGSTDAVNGGQLHDVKTSVTNNTTALNNLKSNTIKLSGDSTSTTAERLDKNGGIEFGVKSGDTHYLTSTATGTDITLDLTSDAKAKIDKATTLASNTVSLGGDTGTTNTQALDKTGGIKFNVKGDGIYLTSNATNDDVTLDLTQATKNKINNAATNKLDNLDPAGIQKIKDTAAWNVVANSGTAQKVEGGDTVKFLNGDNIQITQAGKDFTIATKRDVTFDSVTIPTGNVVINNSGINAGNNKITNVADGTIAPGSKEAVNGGQLHDVQNTINAGAFTVSANGGAKDRIAKDENIDFENADGNIAISYDATGNKFTYNLSPNLNLGPAGSLRIGDALLNNGGLTIVNGPSITSAGVDAGNKKITNVADGTIAAGSKDAINGGQLHDVQTNLQTSINNNAQNIANNTNAINNLNTAVNNPITFTGDSGNNIDRKLGETLNIKGGATGNLTSGNIGVEADSATNTLNVKLAENIDLGTNGSVKTGDTKIDDNGLTINGGPSVTKAGIDAGNKKVTNVANGDITATSKDAVNGSQLHGVADSIKNSIGGNTILNPDGTITTNNIGGTGHNNIHDAIASVNNAANQRTTVVAGDNIDVTVSTNATGGNEYTVATKRDIVVDSVSVANNGPSMNSNGINAGGKTISNLGAGVNPNDAVNVAQLDAVKNSPITFGADTGTDHAATLGSRVSITGDNKNITTSISGNNIQVAMSETPSFGTVNINDANTGTITGASNVTLDNLDEDGTVGRVATEAQLAAVRNEVAGTKDIDNKLRGFKRGADAGTASAMAMAGIPQVINPGENAIGASISAYKQQTAVAVGYTRASKNGRAVLKISGSVNSNSELGFSLGFMKGWD